MTELRIALEAILGGDTWKPCPPDECSDCPFATNPQEVNPADPGEGYYDCTLLSLQRVWGEDPKCKLQDWQKKARQELETMESALQGAWAKT